LPANLQPGKASTRSGRWSGSLRRSFKETRRRSTMPPCSSVTPRSHPLSGGEPECGWSTRETPYERPIPAALWVITQVQPLSMISALPPDVLGDVTAEMAPGPLKVSAYNRDRTVLLGKGVLALVDNQIEAGTGTLRLKATFDNKNNALWPGQFVNARLLLRV